MTGLTWLVGERRREKGDVSNTNTNTVCQKLNKCCWILISFLPPAYRHIITSAHRQRSGNTHIIITRSDWTRRHDKERKNKTIKRQYNQLCLELLNQPTSGPRTCSSDFMQQLMAEAVVLWGESVPVPFCSSSCHWECGQQRAAWMHKYKLEGRIRQSPRARAAPRLRLSQHAARLPYSYTRSTESRGLWSA